MKYSNVSGVVRAATLFILLVCLSSLAGHAEDRRLPGDCKSIAAWVEQNADNLPNSYEELGDYPMAYRRAIFSALSKQEKSALWRDHLQKQLDAAGGALTPGQVQLIEKGIELAGPALFDGRHARIARLRIAAFEKAIRGQFDQAALRAIFGQIGEEAAAAKLLVKTPACSCSSVSDYCPDGHGCDETAGCNKVPDACGTMWTKECDGLCVDPSINVE